MGTLRFRAGRGVKNVAAVEIDYRPIGWVRKFGPNDWRGKLTDDDYPAERGHSTRAEAGAALAEIAVRS